MRKVLVFVSLDGVSQAPGGPNEDPTGGFCFGVMQAPYADEMVGETVGASMSKPFDLLLGRNLRNLRRLLALLRGRASQRHRQAL